MVLKEKGTKCQLMGLRPLYPLFFPDLTYPSAKANRIIRKKFAITFQPTNRKPYSYRHRQSAATQSLKIEFLLTCNFVVP